MNIKVNGEEIEYSNLNDIKLNDFLNMIHISKDRCVISVNNEIIGKSDYTKISLNDGDDVEIIQLMAGG